MTEAADQIREFIAETEAAIDRHANSENPNDIEGCAHALSRIEGMKMALGEIEAERPDARDRVIDRLLDGWEPYWNGQMWARLDLDIGDVVKDEMSDGEAAIIRAHQEKNA